MTKREMQRLHREQFFIAVCETYPGTQIDGEMGGRWTITMENGFTFDLCNISYGGEIVCYEISGSEDHDFAVVLEQRLQLLWDSLK